MFMKYYLEQSSPLGNLTLCSDGENITELEIGRLKRDGISGIYGTEAEKIPVLHKAAKWLRIYFQGGEPAFSIPCRPEGTAFQKRVWKQISRVPYGQMITYGSIAERLNKEDREHRTSPRAVGQAVGRNPIPIFIPCHRIIGAGGRLTGYSGGIDKKIKLLAVEGIPAEKMHL
jgi:methylated-DNA-[protein]-cysteine S-methyltransferase